MTHIMKTTIELPDDLFAEAKAVAARRRTTLKAVFEHALRREISGKSEPSPDARFTVDEHGLPVLKKRDAAVVTSEAVYQMMEDLGI